MERTKGRHQKKTTADLVKIALLGGGGQKIIEFSSFTNDEKHGREGGLKVTFHHFIEPKYD